MEIIIDFTGFQLSNQSIIIKELCIIEISNDDLLSGGIYDCDYYFFKPPLDNHYASLTNEIVDQDGRGHQIQWDAGDIPYELIKEIIMNLTKKARYIYTQGRQKQRWLEDIIDDTVPVIDLEKMRYFTNEAINDFSKVQCPNKYHHSSRYQYSCAFQNTQRLKRWFLEYWSSKPTYEKSVELFHLLEYLPKMHHLDIACLDESFILRFARTQIKLAWDKLPTHLTNNQKFIDYQFCTEHYPPDEASWDVSGIWLYPHRKDCYECRRKK